MIGEVAKVLKGYDALNTQGKRLFRDELGLVRPQQARPRRKKKTTLSVVEPTQASPVRRSRPRNDVPATDALGI